jgi:HSP20 family protein
MSCENNTCGCETPSATETTATEVRTAYRRPAYTVNETADAFAVEVFVPGADRAGVTLELEDDVLTITAKRAASTPSTWRPVRQEIPADDFRLELQLNVPVDQAKIDATVTDGVLRLRLPKAEEVKPRRIDVR